MLSGGAREEPVSVSAWRAWAPDHVLTGSLSRRRNMKCLSKATGAGRARATHGKKYVRARRWG